MPDHVAIAASVASLREALKGTVGKIPTIYQVQAAGYVLVKHPGGGIQLDGYQLKFGDQFLLLDGTDAGVYVVDHDIDLPNPQVVGDSAIVLNGITYAGACFRKMAGTDGWVQYNPQNVEYKIEWKFDMTGNTEPCDRMEGIGD
jgi:hypothetical protein